MTVKIKLFEPSTDIREERIIKKIYAINDLSYHLWYQIEYLYEAEIMIEV